MEILFGHIAQYGQYARIACENEKTSEAQARADVGHEKQARRVKEITGRNVHR